MTETLRTRRIVALVVLVSALLPLVLIGCASTGINKGQANFISSDEEVAMGQAMSVEVAKQYPIHDNRTVTAYVQSVGDKIVRNCDRKDISYHFAVIAKNDANAFCLPGGHLYLYTGLMKVANDEAEFAAVVAHEVGHVAARHSTERLTQQYGYQFLLGLVLGQDPGTAARLIAELAATGGFLKYGRDDEFEADRLGAGYLRAAGYDPQAMVDFLRRIENLETREPSRLETWLMTHPPTSDRIARVKERIAAFSPSANPVRNAAAYAAIKAQLPN